MFKKQPREIKPSQSGSNVQLHRSDTDLLEESQVTLLLPALAITRYKINTEKELQYGLSRIVRMIDVSDVKIN